MDIMKYIAKVEIGVEGLNITLINDFKINVYDDISSQKLKQEIEKLKTNFNSSKYNELER